VIPVRRAEVADAPNVARLLNDFNTEFSDPTPGLAVLTERLRPLIANPEVRVLLGGEPPHGVAVVRFRPSFWTGALDAYLEELYVAPGERGQGTGRALLEAAIEAARRAGAAHIDLATSEEDTAAIALYESCGFTNRESRPDGPTMLYYERDL
jgi:GNAT superfamily N-acetyltransferase